MGLISRHDAEEEKYGEKNIRSHRKVSLYQLIWLLWKKKLVLVLSAFIGTLAVLGGTKLFITPRYKSSIMFYVNNSNVSLRESKLGISQSDLIAAKSLVDTYIVILDTPETKSQISQGAFVSTDDKIIKNITAEAVNSTEIFRVLVTGADKKRL